MERVGSMSQTCIREVTGGTKCSNPGALWYSSAPQDKCREVPQLDHYTFIPNSVPFIIHDWKVFYPKNGSSTFLRNIRKFLQD